MGTWFRSITASAAAFRQLWNVPGVSGTPCAFHGTKKSSSFFLSLEPSWKVFGHVLPTFLSINGWLTKHLWEPTRHNSHEVMVQDRSEEISTFFHMFMSFFLSFLYIFSILSHDLALSLQWKWLAASGGLTRDCSSRVTEHRASNCSVFCTTPCGHILLLNFTLLDVCIFIRGPNNAKGEMRYSAFPNWIWVTLPFCFHNLYLYTGKQKPNASLISCKIL